MTSLLAKRFGNVDGGLLDIGNWFDEALFRPSGLLSASKFGVDVYEKEGNWNIEAAVPGAAKEDISIDIDDGVLTLQVEKKAEKKEEKANYVIKELSYGSQVREFKLPKGVDKANPQAELKDGILKITFAKINKNQIEIK